MSKRIIVVIVLLGTVTSAMAAAWYLFRTTTDDNPALGIIRQHRFFGRVTRVSIDVNRDGTVNGEVLYHWSRPCEGLTVGPGYEYEYREDRNLDGAWDTWLVPVYEQDERTGILVFKADLDNDGKPDWEFKTDDSKDGYDQIMRRRGF